MATTKRAVYRIFNGTDWDIIHFETSATYVGETKDRKFMNPSHHTVNGHPFFDSSGNPIPITLTSSDISANDLAVVPKHKDGYYQLKVPGQKYRVYRTGTSADAWGIELTAVMWVWSGISTYMENTYDISPDTAHTRTVTPSGGEPTVFTMPKIELVTGEETYFDYIIKNVYFFYGGQVSDSGDTYICIEIEYCVEGQTEPQTGKFVANIASGVDKDSCEFKEIRAGSGVKIAEGPSMQYITESVYQQVMAEIVGTAPETLDTIHEIAAALQDGTSGLQALLNSITAIKKVTPASGGANGYILKSNGSSQPTWVDKSTLGFADDDHSHNATEITCTQSSAGGTVQGCLNMFEGMFSTVNTSITNIKKITDDTNIRRIYQKASTATITKTTDPNLTSGDIWIAFK